VTAEMKPAQCCIKLVFHLTYTMMHGNTKLKYTYRVCKETLWTSQSYPSETGRSSLIDRSPYFKYTPASVLENGNFKLYCNGSILTDKTIHFNRPDITFMNKKI
jgi:hypothetical protein